MLARVNSFSTLGIDGYRVFVEVDCRAGMPSFDVVGLPDASVKESRERVRAALSNSGYEFPKSRITVNLAPADMRKVGPSFDLPIAVGIMCCTGALPREALENVVIAGELSLNGDVNAIAGALPIIISARGQGFPQIILPIDNAHEGACIESIDVLPAENVKQVIEHLRGSRRIPPIPKRQYSELLTSHTFEHDFCHVKGHRRAKRALEIAAAGSHNVLMLGEPGSGKTMLARCLPSILPDLSFEEALEVTKIHSISGTSVPQGLLTERPFRSPHHSASINSIVGGGSGAKPGELSKAHHGVLFLDELPEFAPRVLEALRQPLEDGEVTISRVRAQSTYPSRFMLVCAMNPCPCGYYGSQTRVCTCAASAITRYMGKISGPLRDRIDIQLEVESVPVDQLSMYSIREEPSSAIRARVNAARQFQLARYSNDTIVNNSQLDSKRLALYCQLDDESRSLLNMIANKRRLSSRGYTRVIKVARTIADLRASDAISKDDIAEAAQYRSLDGKYWNE